MSGKDYLMLPSDSCDPCKKFVQDPCDPCKKIVPDPCVKVDPCEKPDPCKKPKCVDPCAKSMGYGWGWLGSLILWFIIFTVLFWLVFYSLKPPFVMESGTDQVDTTKVLLAAVVAALILVLIVWLIKVAITNK